MSAGIVDAQVSPFAKNPATDAMRAKDRANRMAIEEERRQDMQKTADRKSPPRGEGHIAPAAHDAGFGRTSSTRRTGA